MWHCTPHAPCSKPQVPQLGSLNSSLHSPPVAREDLATLIMGMRYMSLLPTLDVEMFHMKVNACKVLIHGIIFL